jgi:hypothetical protein
VASEGWPASLENECAAIDYPHHHLGLDGIQLRFLPKIYVAVGLHSVGRVAAILRQLGRVAQEVDRLLTIGVDDAQTISGLEPDRKTAAGRIVRSEIPPGSSRTSILSSVAGMIALSAC